MTMETKCILACIDGSTLGDAVVDHAIWLAENNNVAIKFLHTIEHSHHSEQKHHEGNLTPNIKEHLLDELSDEERQHSKKLIAEGKLILNQAKQKAEQKGLTQIRIQQRHGLLSEALTDLESDALMVVLGAKGEDHQSQHTGLGAQLEEAIRAIYLPTFIVKGPFIEPKRLMFAYNGSPTSRKAIHCLKQGHINHQHLQLHIVCVQKNSQEADALLEQANEIIGEGEQIKTAALVGDTLEQLNQYQQDHDIDITAMGAFSHGKLHGFFFGSFTTQMLLESNTHFLLMR